MENDIFAGLACGIYLIGEDGDITMYPDRNAARQAAVNCSAYGIGCSIVNIEERYCDIRFGRYGGQGKKGEGRLQAPALGHARSQASGRMGLLPRG